MSRFLFILSFILAAATFIFFPELDIMFSNLFYDKQNGFYLAQNPLVIGIHKFVPIMCGITAIIAFLIGLKIFLHHRSFHPKHYRSLIYVTLVCLLGAGFFVHNVIKDSFNRARPNAIQDFGGTSFHTPAFIFSNQCEKNCSFVSGHAAAGFMFFALAFLFKGRTKTYLTIAALLLGTIIGLGRIMEGGHFLSDVIFAGYALYITAYLLALLLKPARGAE
jgi:lipid A 4'-phosphatase